MGTRGFLVQLVGTRGFLMGSGGELGVPGGVWWGTRGFTVV